jgi:hypothetical protein
MTDTRTLYLELIKRCILGLIYQDAAMGKFPDDGEPTFLGGEFDAQLREGAETGPARRTV